MGRRVEIPVKVVTDGTGPLGQIKQALSGITGTANQTQSALTGYTASTAKAGQQTAQMQRAAQQARNSLGQFTAGVKQTRSELGGFEVDISRSLIALAGYAATVKTLTIDTAKYAARTETLAVVTDRLARVNNLSVQAVQAQVQAVRKQGITYQESYQTVNKMIQAQLDLKKATDLARLSQDAAVIGGVNSSQALAGIIHGITTRQTDVLRTYGIIVDFEKEYARAAQKLGRELTAAEKQQVALNAVMAQGVKISGAYEAAMSTAGKQMTSLARHWEDLQQAVGTAFVPALSKSVLLMERMAKFGQENAHYFSVMATAVTGIATGLGAARFLGPLGGLAVGLGTMAFVGGSPKEDAKDAGRRTFEALSQARSREFERFGKIKNPTPLDYETHKLTVESIDSNKEDAIARVTRNLAETYRDKYAGKIHTEWINVGGMNMPWVHKIPDDVAKAIPSSINLGSGVNITREQMVSSLTAKPDAGGALFNQQGYDKAVAEAKAAEAAEAAKKASERAADALITVHNTLARLQLPDSPLTNKPFNVDVARLEGQQDLAKFEKEYKAIKGTPQYNSLMMWQRQVNAERTNQASADDAADIKKAYDARKQFFEAAKREFDKSQGDKMDEEARKLAEHSAAIVEWAKSWGEFNQNLKRVRLDADRDSISMEAGRAERIAQINASTNGDPRVITQQYQIRLNLAQQLYANEMQAAALLQKDLDRRLAEERAFVDWKKSQRQAEIDHELQLLELSRRRINEVRDGAGRVYDAMRQGGRGGLKELAKAQLDSMGRTIFQNVSEKIYTAGVGNMQLPGVGALPPWLVKGTPLEQKGEMILVTSQDKLRASVDRLTGVISGGGFTGGFMGTSAGLIPDFGSLPGVIVDNWGGKKKPGNSTLDMTSYFGFLGGGGAKGSSPVNTAGADLSGFFLGGTGTTAKGGSGMTLSKGLGLGAAGLGIYAGIKQGGAQGTMTAISSGLMGASMFAGPAAPFMQAGALIAGFVGSFMGPDRQGRADEINRSLEANRFQDASPITRSIDMFGRDVDFDYRGNSRVVQNQTVHLTVKALDAKSVMDMGPEIADSVRVQMFRQHGINDEIRQLRGQ